MEDNAWPMPLLSAGSLPGLNIEATWYVDPLDLSNKRAEALRRTLRYGLMKGQKVKQARRAFRKALVEKFHSFGENCEFGFVQRQFSADPLDLFRFSSASAEQIAAAIDDGFESFRKPENLSLTFDGGYVGIYESGLPELTVWIEPYGFRFHGGGLPVGVRFDEVKAAQSQRLNLLARNLIDDLEDAERIFVYKSATATRAGVDRLHAALRRLGPNILLWVTLPEEGREPGSVEMLGEGLMRGTIDRFASLSMKDISNVTWLKICCEALRLSQRLLYVP